MQSASNWQFDEKKAHGVDYADPGEVAAYDEMHTTFRDYARSTEKILETLELGPGSSVIDMGSGTGAFSLYAARTCREVHAVDPSEAMLAFCREQAEARGLANVVFHHAGLLSYEHTAEPADALVCVAVLHHLPDFWKQVALARCRAMLKPAGRMYLFDVVFPSGEADIDQQLGTWIETVRTMAGDRLADEAAVHARDEFSTYDWVMEGMLRRGGFRIDTAGYTPGFQATYVCTRR